MGIIHDKNMVFLKLLVLLIVSLGIRSTKGEFVEVRPTRDEMPLMNRQFNRNMLETLGIQLLKEGRIRFGGKTLKGVRLPENKLQKNIVVEKILKWYWPCFEKQDDGYQLDMDCFAEHEDEYLKHLANTVSNLRFKYIL